MSKPETAKDESSIVVHLASLIVRPENNPRGEMDKDELDRLTADVQSRGVQTPVLVMPADDGSSKFVLVAGFRRYTAAKACKMTTIPARVISVAGNLDSGVKADQRAEANAFLASVAENEVRSDLTPVDRALAAARLRSYGFSYKTIGEKLRTGESNANNLARVGQLSAPTLAKLRKLPAPFGAGLFVLGKKPANEAEEAAALDEWVARTANGGAAPRASANPATNGPAENGPAGGGETPKRARAGVGDIKKSVSSAELESVAERLRSSAFWDDADFERMQKRLARDEQPFSGEMTPGLALAAASMLLMSCRYGTKNEANGPFQFLGIEETKTEAEEAAEAAAAEAKAAKEAAKAAAEKAKAAKEKATPKK